MQKFMVSIQFSNENIRCLNPSISGQCCYHRKPVNWLAEEINWLISTWSEYWMLINGWMTCKVILLRIFTSFDVCSGDYFLIIKFNLIFFQFASNYCSNYSWAIGSSKKSRIIVNVLDLNLRFWFVCFFIYRNQKKIGIFQAKFHLSRVHLLI